jgi:hypothetical protein
VKVGQACPAAWREVRFANLRVPDGRLSGERQGDAWNVRRE